MSDFIIRLAVIEDVEQIRIAHRQSILDLAAKDYPKEVIAEWGINRTPESIQRQKDAIHSDDEIYWVAVRQQKIVGFSCLVPKNEELRSLWSPPQLNGQGFLRLSRFPILQRGLILQA